MKKDTLRELAVVLTETIRANASIDWRIKEDVRAKIKVLVKRTLRKYGYPPDMQKLATETVLQQAEKIADELTAVGIRRVQRENKRGQTMQASANGGAD